MSRQRDLRGYQQELLARFQAVEEAPAAVSKLGFLVGDERWLIDISSVAEVLPVPDATRFPLTRPWFAGIANVRGDLVGLVDLGEFLTGVPSLREPHNRVLVLAPSVVAHCGLVVSRMLGLRRADELERRAERGPRTRFAAALYAGTDGTMWKELDTGALASDQSFLDVGDV